MSQDERRRAFHCSADKHAATIVFLQRQLDNLRTSVHYPQIAGSFTTRQEHKTNVCQAMRMARGKTKRRCKRQSHITSNACTTPSLCIVPTWHGMRGAASARFRSSAKGLAQEQERMPGSARKFCVHFQSQVEFCRRLF